MEKQCSKCETVKEASEFYKRAKSKDGLQNYCKDCQREARSEWEHDNADHLREYKALYYAGGREVKPRKEHPTYRAIHFRVRATKGPAANYACVACEGKASDWAYSNLCPEELTGMNSGVERRYCVHIDCYQPMCRPCHRKYDKQEPLTVD